MKLSRLRSGERLALAGSVALAVLLGLDWWFLSTPEAIIGAHESGIRSLGWFAELLLIAAIACGLALGFFTLTQRATALPTVFGVLSMLFGLLATFTILLRLIFQPTLGVEASGADVDVELPAILGLFAAAAIFAGGWIATLDERTDSEEAIEQTEEALMVRGDNPRPAPPASAVPSES
jgi:hypothetical protein